MLVALIGQSIPGFWLGLMLILLFAVELGWLPTSGRGGLETLVLPACTLAMFYTGRLARVVRRLQADHQQLIAAMRPAAVRDVAVDGISMAVTQRSEFASVIQRNGGQVQGLIAMLREKTASGAPR